MTAPWPLDEAGARALDAADALGRFRAEFEIPPAPGPDGGESIYLCGNSLGLLPKRTRAVLNQELDDWGRLAVEGHFHAKSPWLRYHEQFAAPLARLVGAEPAEVVAMNSLTVNLHLLMASFYRPTTARHRILIDGPTFPSDLYAVKSQLGFHGYDPAEGLISLQPRPGEETLRTDDILEVIERRGDEIALLLLSGVNFYTGQAYDMARITAAARARGCVVGWDLAHAAGNIPLQLHDWGVDFAAWCHYKYVNAGPGAVAGAFVHERHARRPDLPRLAGWWGNDPETRFRMQLEPTFVPRAGADGWQISNPPILALAPLSGSLELFDAAGLPALRARSVRLTGYLEHLIGLIPNARYTVITPTSPEERGCQLSLLVNDDPQGLLHALERHGVILDFRAPNVIRVAPTPLYNSFHDVWRFARVLAGEVGAPGPGDASAGGMPAGAPR